MTRLPRLTGKKVMAALVKAGFESTRVKYAACFPAVYPHTQTYILQVGHTFQWFRVILL